MSGMSSLQVSEGEEADEAVIASPLVGEAIQPRDGLAGLLGTECIAMTVLPKASPAWYGRSLAGTGRS
jgi:hypothetical protein